MHKNTTLLSLLILTTIFLSASSQKDEDIIDITNITIFPQDYKHNISAGYLNVTPNNQALYYIFCLRYTCIHPVKITQTTILLYCGSTEGQAVPPSLASSLKTDPSSSKKTIPP